MPFTGLEIWNSKYLQKVQLFSFPQFCHSTNASNKWLCKGFLGEQLSVISYLWSTNSHNPVPEHQPEMHFSECSLLLPPNHQPPMFISSGHKKASRLARPMSVKSPSINSFCNFWTCCLHCLAVESMQKATLVKQSLKDLNGLFLGALWWISGMDERILLFFSDVPVEKRRNLTTFSDANGCHTARCIPNHLAPSRTCVCFCPFPSPKHRFGSYEMFHHNTHQTMCVMRVSQCRWAPFVSPDTWTTCCSTQQK